MILLLAWRTATQNLSYGNHHGDGGRVPVSDSVPTPAVPRGLRRREAVLEDRLAVLLRRHEELAEVGVLLVVLVPRVVPRGVRKWLSRKLS